MDRKRAGGQGDRSSAGDVIQAGAPFFSNDIAGVIKLAVSLGALGGAVILTFVKWGQSKFAEDIKDTKAGLKDITEQVNKTATMAEVNALGSRVNDIDRGCIEQAALAMELRSRVDRHEVLLQQMVSQQGENRAGIAALRDQGTSLQHDMTMLITESSSRVQTSVHDLALKVESLRAGREERDRLGAIFERFITDKGKS